MGAVVETAWVAERLKTRVGQAVEGVQSPGGDEAVVVSASALPDVCRFLRDEPDLRFEMLNCITAVDYLQTDPKKAAKTPWQPHLELLYHLSSLTHHARLVLKVLLPRWRDDVPGRLPQVPSVTGVWKAADWHEREVYDLSGVEFTGHPDLRRILCPEDWEGHPLRKDYQMPKEYHGIRVR